MTYKSVVCKLHDLVCELCQSDVSSQNMPQQTMLQPESIWQYYDSCKNYNFLNMLIRGYNLVINNNNQKLFISVQTENNKNKI